MNRAIGLVELNSIARGIAAADAMLKAAHVELVTCRPVCPGKYVVLVSGDVATVETAVRAGVSAGDVAVVDHFVLPNVHPSVFPAIIATTSVATVQALGIIETFSLASLVVAADTAVKAGPVELLEIRLGVGIGGKSFATLTGDVAAVKAAVEAGAASATAKGLLVERVVIPSPHASLTPGLL